MLIDLAYTCKNVSPSYSEVETDADSNAASLGKNGHLDDANAENIAIRKLFLSRAGWILSVSAESEDQNG